MKKLIISVSILLLSSLGAMAQKMEAVSKIVDCGQSVYKSPATAEFEI